MWPFEVRRGGGPLSCARRKPGRSGRDQGFTLLEVLVAVAILAVLVAIVPRSLVYARGIVNRSESWTEARLVAEAVLNEELAGARLGVGTMRGRIDGREWTATLTPNRTLSVRTAGSNRALFQVRVVVKVSPVEALTIETLRIGQVR